jgi:integrase
MGRVFKRDDATNYFAHYFDPRVGKWVKKSTKTADRKSAEACLRELERIANGAPGQAGAASHAAARGPVHTLGDTVDALVRNGIATGTAAGTVRMWTQKAGHLVRLLGRECDINTLTRDDLQDYINARYAEGAALSTVAKEVITFRRALREAGDKFRGSASMFPKVKVKYEPRTRYLTPAELGKLLEHLSPPRQLWVLVAVYTGACYSEVAKLDWSDIKWTMSPAMIHIRGTKRAKRNRVVPLNPTLGRWLWPLRRASGPVVGHWGNVRRSLHEACARAKIQHVSPNDLRRTHASWLKQSGVDSAVVAALLGHSSTKMVDLVYGKLDTATLARAVALLPGRDTDGTNVSAFGGQGEQPAPLPTSENARIVAETLVLGVGIEPTTRGFSVREFVDTNERFIRKLLAGQGTAGHRRDTVSPTKPALRLMGRR